MARKKEHESQDAIERNIKVRNRAKTSLDVLRIWGGEKGKQAYDYFTTKGLLNDDIFKEYLYSVHVAGETFGRDEMERYLADRPNKRQRHGRFLDVDGVNRLLSTAYTACIFSCGLNQQEVEHLNSILDSLLVGAFLFEFLDTIVFLDRADRIIEESRRDRTPK